MDGLLDFQYKNRLSRGREEFLLTQVERGMMTEVLKTKAITEAIFSTINPKNLIEKALSTTKDYGQMALPYLGQQGTLDTRDIPKQDIANIKKRLEAAKKKAQQDKGKK